MASSCPLVCSIYGGGGGGGGGDVNNGSWVVDRKMKNATTNCAALVSHGASPALAPPPPIVIDSLKVLEWEEVCDSVASFAGTCFGKQLTKEQLWSLNNTYEDSLNLLQETKAAVELRTYGSFTDFAAIDTALVKSSIQCARRGWPVSGNEAMALVSLLQCAEALQLNLKTATKEDTGFYKRSMPLSETIMELVVSRSLMTSILQVVTEDGSVKDSASPALKQSRDQVLFLEKKLNQLLQSLIKNQMKETSAAEVSNFNGRWCIKSSIDCQTSFEGLLLSSGLVAGTMIEPLPAVALNDSLQEARASVADAVADVLLKITYKMQQELNDIEDTLRNMVQLDAVNARARYSISYGGSFPDLFFPPSLKGTTSFTSNPPRGKWMVYLPKAYHPLLVRQHREKLQKAMKDVSDATAEIRRRRHGGGVNEMPESDLCLSSLKMKVDEIRQAPPVPIDISVSLSVRVVVITGPNTGGKTICLKTAGLAFMMAKSGLYVLSSEPARLPWCDFVFADIGDEQSLSQSLSTFSGHLKQITDIISHSTCHSLALLDEVGAGTNPLEGAALGSSLLEYFAEAGPLLTMATTHHGELKTLKYGNTGFENACMEFDEVNLKPTFRILWGVPGRSNAIDIAERLGLPSSISNGARELYGEASAEINEIVLVMERFKQISHKQVHEAERYLILSKNLYRGLIAATKEIHEHGSNLRHHLMQEMSKAAAAARSLLHEKVRQLRRIAARDRTSIFTTKVDNISRYRDQSSTTNANAQENSPMADTSNSNNNQSPIADMSKRLVGISKGNVGQVPRKGDVVQVVSLRQKALVLKVEPSKDEIIVQLGKLKLNVKLADIVV